MQFEYPFFLNSF